MSASRSGEMDPELKEGDLTCFTNESRHQGEVVGNRTTMKRKFSTWNIIALGFNISNSWIGIAASFAIAISTGGTVSLLYGIILVAFTMVCTAMSLAELGSVYPTAGGQYHFTWFIAPNPIRHGLSYVDGITSVFAWISLSASINIVTAEVLIALVLRYDASYAATRWQVFLLYEALNITFTLHNAFFLRKTLWIYNFGAALSVALCVAVTIICPVRSPTKASSHSVWTTFVNSSKGWPDGICFLTGISTPQFMLMGLDSVLHLAEECIEPEKVIPKALMATVSVGAVTAFAFAVSMVYSVPDVSAALETSTGFPIYAIWEDGTRSDVAATIFIACFLAVCIVALNAAVQTASRITWSFARDDALWQSSRLASIHPTLDVPLWSLLLNSFATLLIGIVFLASSTAFNAFIGSAAITSQVSIAIPILLLLLRKRHASFLPPDRTFKLPKLLGYFLNTVTVVWAVVLLIFLCLPTSFPVTGSNMNYSSAVLGMMACFSAFNWVLYARKHYQGPQVDLEH